MPLSHQISEQIRWIKATLHEEYADLFEQCGSLSHSVHQKLTGWQHRTRLDLLQQNPFAEHETHLAAHEASDFNQQAIDEYELFCKQAGIPFEADFWQKELENAKKPESRKRNLSLTLLLQKWREQLDKAKTRWYLEQLEKLRQDFLAQLEKALDIIKQLSRQLEQLGLEAGFWLDNSLGSLSDQDIEEMQRWLNYLTEDEGARQIAELLGKMRQIEQSEKIEHVKQTVYIPGQRVDVNSREEIIGLRLGKELEYMLPSELALMADEETSVLFDLKFLESKLMSFELQGLEHFDRPIETTVEQKSSEDEKLGPMILCVDTSGSMRGTPENIAKAVALFLGTKAASQKRPCFVVNFSTGIETFEIANESGMADLVAFLRRSFHGGTDAAPALRHTLQVMEKEKYKKADLLMISDFVMNRLPADLREAIAVQRKTSNRFHSLVIGSAFMSERLKTHFDHEWIYDPQAQKIRELAQFQKDISGS